MNLHSANPHPLAGGKHFQFFLLADRPGNESASHDRAEAFHGEHTIHGKPNQRRRIFRRDFRRDFCERGFKIVQTRAG